MNQPTEHDAVLGGTPQITAVVLGGIEGAKQRYYASTTFSERVSAIQEIAKYDSTEAKKYSPIVLNINTDLIKWNRLQEAIRANSFRVVPLTQQRNALANAVQSFTTTVASPEFQASVRQIGTSVQELQDSIEQCFKEFLNTGDVQQKLQDMQLEAEQQQQADKELEQKHRRKFQYPSYLTGVKKIVGKK